MLRILILLAVVLGVIWWLRARAEARLAEMRARQQAREASERAAASAANAGNAGQPVPPAEPMVQCAHCGVHLPQGEAIAWRGLHYCRRSHLPDEAGTGSDNGTGTGTGGPGA
ncbi:PP0621 family protein [Cupriavidus necator]